MSTKLIEPGFNYSSLGIVPAGGPGVGLAFRTEKTIKNCFILNLLYSTCGYSLYGSWTDTTFHNGTQDGMQRLDYFKIRYAKLDAGLEYARLIHTIKDHFRVEFGPLTGLSIYMRKKKFTENPSVTFSPQNQRVIPYAGVGVQIVNSSKKNAGKFIIGIQATWTLRPLERIHAKVITGPFTSQSTVMELFHFLDLTPK
ncbi:MAG TPA: hypothetical protein VI731_02040, partial [Bacteroidia bacterium]|nr:hypothetical protein [Bacteroidia bacterium]